MCTLVFKGLFDFSLHASNIGAFSAAKERVQLMLQHAPRHPDIHNLMGVIYGRVDHQEAAVKHFQKAIALKGNAPNYHFNLAEAYRIWVNSIKRIKAIDELYS